MKDDSFDNLDISPEEFRKLGYRVIDMIADYYSGIGDVPVFPACTAADVEKAFAESLPEQGQDPGDILDEWQSKVLPYATHLGSPRYFGYVNGSGSMIGTLAEALSASVNMNSGGWKPAPSATEIERRTIAWLAELIHYPADCAGLLTSGGTMANYTALEAALRNTAGIAPSGQGLKDPALLAKCRVYMSDHEGHISIMRCASLLNLGEHAVRLIRSRPDFSMDPDDLEQQLDRDIADGLIPFCVVAQVGSINVGVIDPLERIAGICSTRGIWFHADGACGAVGAMLPEKRAQYKGLELADSVTLDPHKWLYIPYECGCVLVREERKLEDAFSMTAPYLRESIPTEYDGYNYYHLGPQMSRGFRALKLWMTLKHYGADGYRKLLSQNNRCAEYLDELVRKAPDFEALHRPNLFIYSFRYCPSALVSRWSRDPDALDEHLDTLNQEIVNAIQISGTAFIMTTRIHERVVIRLSICSHRTTLSDIDMVFGKLREFGEALQGKHMV